MRVTQDPQQLRLSDDISSFSDSVSMPRQKETGRRSGGTPVSQGKLYHPEKDKSNAAPAAGGSNTAPAARDNSAAGGDRALALALDNGGYQGHGLGIGVNAHNVNAHTTSVCNVEVNGMNVNDGGGGTNTGGSGGGTGSGTGDGSARARDRFAPSLASRQTEERGTNSVIETYDHFRCIMCKQKPLNSHASARCGHIACHACWDRWLIVNESCPVCRERTRLANLVKVRF